MTRGPIHPGEPVKLRARTGDKRVRHAAVAHVHPRNGSMRTIAFFGSTGLGLPKGSLLVRFAWRGIRCFGDSTGADSSGR